MQAPPSLGGKMARSEQSWGIPTELSLRQFRQFVLPHLTVGRRGPAPKLSLHTLFNYILKVLYLGCQWKELPIAKDADGRPEIHYTRSYGAFRRWQGSVGMPQDCSLLAILTPKEGGACIGSGDF